ncbi:hypothetical protein [Burkholderia cenocepacia]|uniref:hypothetical protein n=1 Tax=Burkholderia cenocepacia TaxID=95486 RepID=UPI000A690419|nr:hypothetical protein [Burkholderia cenocepacia]
MRTVLCFRDIKAASLYFDRVLPVAFMKMTGTGNDIVTEFPEPVPSRALINIVFDKTSERGAGRYTDLGRVIDSWHSFAKEARPYLSQSSRSSNEFAYDVLAGAYIRNAAALGSRPLRDLFADYATSLGIKQMDVLLPSTDPAAQNADEDAVVSLCHLSLIDAERASWEQIEELRSDQQARTRLQRLRAFAQTNYQGKPVSYIEDDLSARIEEYELASSKHGFDLVTGTLSTLLDSTHLQATVGAALAAAIVGGPIAAVSTAACIELGKVSLEFSKRKRVMADWHKSHPLAYLIEARRLHEEN